MKYTVYVLSIGVVNITTGKTMYDWSIYDDKNTDSCVYLCNDGFLLYSIKGTFKVGDEVVLRGNDNNRKLKESTVIDMFPCTHDELVEGLLKNKYDYRQVRAFTKKKYKRKLSTSYSVKGYDYFK